jgi:hypothetical protein
VAPRVSGREEEGGGGEGGGDEWRGVEVMAFHLERNQK